MTGAWTGSGGGGWLRRVWETRLQIGMSRCYPTVVCPFTGRSIVCVAGSSSRMVAVLVEQDGIDLNPRDKEGYGYLRVGARGVRARLCGDESLSEG